MTRAYDVDNLRSLAVLLLFPFHTARIFDTLEPFYVKGKESELASLFILFCVPWFMPLLFTLSGISTYYALKKRDSTEYVHERFWKLLIPFLSGILLLIPVQTYFAEKFHHEFSGNYFQQYWLFFTKETNLTGYFGGFTPGQLWFLLYLFILSIIALPFIHWLNFLKTRIRNVPLFYGIFVFSSLVLALPLNGLMSVDGKNLGDFFLLFVAGYFILTNKTFVGFLDRCFWGILGVTILLFIVKFYGQSWMNALSFSLLMKGLSIFSILSLLEMGRKCLNFRNPLTDYLVRASFPLYIFHQSWIILIAYYTLPHFSGVLLPFFLIMSGSLLFSLLSYELCRRFRLTRVLFGIK